MEKNFFNDNDLSEYLRHVSLNPETEQLIIDRMNNMDQEMCCGSSDCKEKKCCLSDEGENFAQPRVSVINEDTNNHINLSLMDGDNHNDRTEKKDKRAIIFG